SKGGFVSVPVVMGAHKLAPVVIHESDYSPGLANKIANRYATAVCVTFEDTLKHVGDKGVFTGTPIRKELYTGSREAGFRFTGLYPGKPVVLMIGGSLGAQAVNDALREALPELLQYFNIVHLCGKGKLDASLEGKPGYVQYEYISKELPDLFAMADVVLSRAGANAIFELLALHKPSVLVPLPLSASRGDQLQNAAYFEKKCYAYVLPQEQLSTQSLSVALREAYMNMNFYKNAMEQEPNADGTEAVLAVIRKAAEGSL
ncbi:MAG: glycosyltransferase, partial [Eubacteriales bacterium]|nr:glycosyltransferase [Eubacteriales bacterium]